jgi:hypothetical protein
MALTIGNVHTAKVQIIQNASTLFQYILKSVFDRDYHRLVLPRYSQYCNNRHKTHRAFVVPSTTSSYESSTTVAAFNTHILSTGKYNHKIKDGTNSAETHKTGYRMYEPRTQAVTPTLLPTPVEHSVACPNSKHFAPPLLVAFFLASAFFFSSLRPYLYRIISKVQSPSILLSK